MATSGDAKADTCQKCGAVRVPDTLHEAVHCLRNQLADRERVARYWYGRRYNPLRPTPPGMKPDWLTKTEDGKQGRPDMESDDYIDWLTETDEEK